MRKTILFALMVVGLTALYLVEASVSQAQRARDIAVSQEQTAGDIAVEDISDFKRGLRDTAALQRPRRVLGNQALIDDTQETKSQHLRYELLKLYQHRLQTMSEEELIASKIELQKELDEYDAKAKLQQAEKLLQEILKTYPKSRAAKQARRMLESQLKAEFYQEEEAEN